MTARGKADDRVWKALRLKVKDIDKRRVKVGVIGGKLVEEGTMTVAELAAIHEYGAPAAGIEPRSFIRFTFNTRRADMFKLCEGLARKILSDKIGVDRALGLLGAWAVAAIQKSITSKAIRQELAPATIRRKQKKPGGAVTALVDTGQLKNSITWAIEEKP